MGIARITRMPVDKGTVSKWENDSTANPTNANLLALQAITGYSAAWLVRGDGEKLARNAVDRSIDEAVLGRSILLVFPKATPNVIKAIATLYDLIHEAPDVPTSVLQRTAEAFLDQSK